MIPKTSSVDITDAQVIQSIWEKGLVIEGYDKNMYRQDFAGAWISRDKYGDTNSTFGWEIDHVYPKELGGDDHFINLRPMNWRNNRSKGTDFPKYQGTITSEKNRNIEKEVNCMIRQSLVEELTDLYNIQ